MIFIVKIIIIFSLIFSVNVFSLDESLVSFLMFQDRSQHQHCDLCLPKKVCKPY